MAHRRSGLHTRSLCRSSGPWWELSPSFPASPRITKRRWCKHRKAVELQPEMEPLPPLALAEIAGGLDRVDGASEQTMARG